MIDESLVRAMKNKEQAAFGQCYQQLSSYLYSIIYRICGVSAVAEEIMQDSFIQGFTSIDQLQQDSHFVGWIKRIAFNQTMSYLRQSKREVNLGDDCPDGLEKDASQIQPTALFDQQLLEQNQMAHLMQKLSEIEKLVVWLYVVEGYSHQEIATLCEKSVSFSKSIVSRSLTKMRAADTD